MADKERQFRLNSVGTGWDAEPLREEAYRLLQELQAAAARTQATELDRLCADTAKSIVELAEKEATCIDARLRDAKIVEFQQWGVDVKRALDRDIAISLDSAGRGSEAASVKALQREALDKLTAKEKEFAAWLGQHGLTAWDKACDRLTALRAGWTVERGLRGEG